MTEIKLQSKELLEFVKSELIKGDFNPEDASEIINTMITKKIDFHRARNFSSEIRFDKKDEKSLARAEELEKSKTALNKVINLAKEQNKNIRIDSTISIQII
ncbi:MAG: hypothetical protein KDD29_00415 [Flavobacteriales bacterium]|nr:hypothetical protein [Flavobacteriales bacterium]MCB9336224.1 hypothetical protein [Flavobacteriales bacterium]